MVNKILSRFLPVFQIYTKFFKFLTKKPNFNWLLSILLLNFIVICMIDFTPFGRFSFILIEYIFIDTLTIFCSYILPIFLLYLISQNIAKTTLKFIAFVSLFAFIFELFTLLNFNSAYSVFILDALLNTNKNEAVEFIQTFFDFKFLFYALITVGFFVFVQKLKEPKISKICVIISFIILVASVSVLFHKGTKGENFDTKNLVQNTIFRLVAVTSEYFSDKNPLSSIKTAEINYQKHSRLNKDTIAQNRERERERVKNVIVIIGESLSRHYMSLYGYEKPTTPFLKNLEKSGNLISFSDIISPYTSTNPVLEYALNFNNYESKDKRHYSDSLNMLDMFNLAGYKTFWISNQEFNGRYTMATTSISARADEIKFTGSLGTRNSFRYDSEILQFLSNKTDGFYIIHLMGSHSLYRERYPDEYAKFKSNELNEPLNKKQKDRLAKYLNSVFYNDFIINEIYKVFKDDDSLILYFSDHGESLYEFKGLSGHGFVTRFTCEIPFMFIASDEFKTKHGELWQKIQEAKDKPFMTDDLPHTLADIIGVKPLEYDENRSLISPNFNTLRKRIMQGVDYETIKNQKAYE